MARGNDPGRWHRLVSTGAGMFSPHRLQTIRKPDHQGGGIMNTKAIKEEEKANILTGH